MVCFIKTNHYNVTIGLYGNHSHFTTTPTPASPPPPLPLHHRPHSASPPPPLRFTTAPTPASLPPHRGQSLNQTPTAKLAQNMQNCHTNVMPPRPSQLHPLQLGVLVLLALSPRSSLIPILTFQWHFWGTRS